MPDRPEVTIYSDGGASPNPGPGGWGVLLIAANGATKELSGAEAMTTNNRMELTAALEALRALKRPCRVQFYTDSQYLRRGITEWLPGWVANGWQRKKGRELQNEDLWRALHTAIEPHEIEWHWVKGHAGDLNNERVDHLATAARQDLVAESAAALLVDYEIALRISVSGKRGGWAVRVLAVETDETTVYTGCDANTPPNRLVLVAALEALRATPPDSAIRFYTNNSYLRDGITTWVKGWQKRGWVKRDGDPVKFNEVWQALVAECEQRAVQWIMEGAEPPPLAEGLDAMAAEARQG